MTRVGDLTLGDFWGLRPDELPDQQEKGISLLLVNTPHGAHVFDTLPLKRELRPLRTAAACLAGLAMLYAVGLPYMAVILNGYMGKGMDISAILWAGMLPFLPGDMLKIAVTALLAPLLQKRLSAVS